MMLPVIEAVVDQLVKFDSNECDEHNLDVIVASSMTGILLTK
jgi:hypothetical protein